MNSNFFSIWEKKQHKNFLLFIHFFFFLWSCFFQNKTSAWGRLCYRTEQLRFYFFSLVYGLYALLWSPSWFFAPLIELNCNFVPVSFFHHHSEKLYIPLLWMIWRKIMFSFPLKGFFLLINSSLTFSCNSSELLVDWGSGFEKTRFEKSSSVIWIWDELTQYSQLMSLIRTKPIFWSWLLLSLLIDCVVLRKYFTF